MQKAKVNLVRVPILVLTNLIEITKKNQAKEGVRLLNCMVKGKIDSWQSILIDKVYSMALGCPE